MTCLLFLLVILRCCVVLQDPVQFFCHTIIHTTLDSNIPNHLHFPTFSLTPPTSACSSHPTNLLCLVNSYSFFKTDNILLPPRIFHSFLQADKGFSYMLSQYRVIITLMCQSLFHFFAWLDCKRPWRAENVVFNSPLLTVAQCLPCRRCLINIC